MRLSLRFVFFVFLASVGQSIKGSARKKQVQNTTFSSEPSSEKQEIIVLQRRLWTTSLHDERVVVHANLDRAIQSAAHRIKQVFQETPRPAERGDSDLEIGKGTMLWYLHDVSRWWVTALAIQLSDSLVVLHHASGERKTCHRGVEVRAVRNEDKVVWWSQFLRDQAEFARLKGYQEEQKKKYFEALEVDPTNAHALDNLGIYYTHQGDFENAKLYFEKAIQANEKWWHPYFGLGVLYRDHLTSPREALRLFDSAFQLNPHMLDSLWHLAETHSRMGNFEEECYHWRLLRVFNRNPYEEREFGMWNVGWENFTAHRIDQCMAAAGEKQEVKNNSNEEL